MDFVGLNGSLRHIEVKAARVSGGALEFLSSRRTNDRQSDTLPNYWLYLVLQP